MNRHVIIVAGGKGLRMGGDIPKQFLPVGGKPVLMRTIEAFYAFDSSIHIILVLPVSQRAYWKDLCETHHFALRHDIDKESLDSIFEVSKYPVKEDQTHDF